jgi:chaperone required for assembly of F1-ATPase
MTKPSRVAAPVYIEAHDEGFALMRGGRLLRTPAGLAFVLPTRALAAAIAAEWNEATDDPARRPLTRLANTAIDRVRAGRRRVEAELANYAATDLLCYRAESEPLLAAREAVFWDPLLDWAAENFEARLRVTVGLVPVAQPIEALDAVQSALARESDFALAALHATAALTSSLVLALALARGRCTADEVWRAATIDESWQAERWGADALAEARASKRKAELGVLARFAECLAEQS